MNQRSQKDRRRNDINKCCRLGNSNNFKVLIYFQIQIQIKIMSTQHNYNKNENYSKFWPFHVKFKRIRFILVKRRKAFVSKFVNVISIF